MGMGDNEGGEKSRKNIRETWKIPLSWLWHGDCNEVRSFTYSDRGGDQDAGIGGCWAHLPA